LLRSIAMIFMPGLVPGIRILLRLRKKMRVAGTKPGHDEKPVFRLVASDGH